MGRIKGRDTSPERIVRSILRGLGFKHRLHDAALPGTPDIVIDAAKTVILVHGCFWHRHCCPRGRSSPATRAAFWQAKFARNIRRDRQAARALRRSGWSVVIVWECQISRASRGRLTSRLRRFLDSRFRAAGAERHLSDSRIKKKRKMLFRRRAPVLCGCKHTSADASALGKAICSCRTSKRSKSVDPGSSCALRPTADRRTVMWGAQRASRQG
ncbi:MAG: very short patch repair endonuclease [Phycisphaerae bacterium]|nr:very short patch repair endonuclease [Phycisphaerae bacterium]